MRYQGIADINFEISQLAFKVHMWYSYEPTDIISLVECILTTCSFLCAFVINSVISWTDYILWINYKRNITINWNHVGNQKMVIRTCKKYWQYLTSTSNSKREKMVVFVHQIMKLVRLFRSFFQAWLEGSAGSHATDRLATSFAWH